MRWTIALGTALALGAPVAMAPAALAACAGTTNTIIVCVDPTGNTLYEDCVMVVDPPCKPVTVRGPKVWCEGANASVCVLPWN